MNEFQDTPNPFAAPTGPADGATPFGEYAGGGLWRDGKDLVMHQRARLPPLCVKTGAEVHQKGIIRKLSWHNPLIAISILAGCIVYVILSVILTKSATIEIPLSVEARKKRKNAMIFCTVLGLVSIAGFFGSFILAADRGTEGIGIIAMVSSIIIGVACLAIGNGKSRILRPTKITDTHLWLRGVHPSITDGLPILPKQ